MADRVQVFARAPVPGAVKTRLEPELGAEGAADLHRRLVERTVATACAAGVAPVELWCAPDRSHPFFAELAARFGTTLHDQPEGDLGRRMHAALEAALVDGGRGVLVGCDCPVLEGHHLAAAFEALDAHDVVLGPAEDGGYVLVGARRVSRPMFDGIGWGGPRVLRETRARLVALGWRWHELPVLWDVDRPDDLERLAAADLA